VNVHEHQRRIEENQRKKEEKILKAKMEKEQKEMQECSFAPKLVTKKKKTSANQSQVAAEMKRQ
jgi:hypothetical protein